MAVQEKVLARTRDGQKISRVYLVSGESTETGARDALLFAIAATLDGYERDDDSVSVEEIADSFYLGTVNWIKPEGDCSFQFDISTGSQHITQSKETVAKFGPNQKNHEGAIGVSKENGKQKIAGCDVEVPTLSFTVNRQLEHDDLDDAYFNAVWLCAGKTNDAEITINGFTFGHRELLFVGLSGTEDENGKWNLSYKFLASQSLVNYPLPKIGNIDKKGWEYMWVEYDDVEDATSYSIAKQPNAAYVERIYDDADFSTLDLCT